VRELVDARFLDEQEEQHTGLYVALADPADSGFTAGCRTVGLIERGDPERRDAAAQALSGGSLQHGILFKLAGLIERGDPNNATPPPKHWAGFDRSDHVPESAPGFGKMGVPVIVVLAALPSASPAQ
jgi:hypothetical protein